MYTITLGHAHKNLLRLPRFGPFFGRALTCHCPWNVFNFHILISLSRCSGIHGWPCGRVIWICSVTCSSTCPRSCWASSSQWSWRRVTSRRSRFTLTDWCGECFDDFPLFPWSQLLKHNYSK